jgi:hypothetical protein
MSIDPVSSLQSGMSSSRLKFIKDVKPSWPTIPTPSDPGEPELPFNPAEPSQRNVDWQISNDSNSLLAFVSVPDSQSHSP